MAITMKKRVLQDYSLIHQHVERAKTDFTLSADGNAFYYVILPLLLDLQDDEVDDAVTDEFYQAAKGHEKGKDRGIDAIFVDTKYERPSIHLFSCKYSSTFEKTEGFFPSNEINKIETFLGDLMRKNQSVLKEVNPTLSAKIVEIWNQMEHGNPTWVVHICSNLTETFAPDEEARFQRLLNRYSNFSSQYHTQSSLAARLTRKGRTRVDGKMKAIDQNLFEQSGGDIRALIVHVDALELIKLLCNREDLRRNANLPDTESLKSAEILEDAFEDNIRIYLQQRSKVNRNIKATALSEESKRFFYFNNGITLTCDHFSYPKSQRGPVIELENIQVVNGGQTIHALFEAFRTDPEKLRPVELLCRIYETRDRELSSRIAECTNSQSPVKTRDIRSIDLVQMKLEKEFGAIGYFYERKKNQFANQIKARRLDAEKCGQVVLAFFEDMPLEAKNKKGLIFGEKYDDIFSEEVTAHRLLLPYVLFERIEKEREKRATGSKLWLRYASYHMLYSLKLLATKKGIQTQWPELEPIWKLCAKARKVVGNARNSAKAQQREFADVLFFKSGTAKKMIESEIDAS